jgi:hypothetical protein
MIKQNASRLCELSVKFHLKFRCLDIDQLITNCNFYSIFRVDTRSRVQDFETLLYSSFYTLTVLYSTLLRVQSRKKIEYFTRSTEYPK